MVTFFDRFSRQQRRLIMLEIATSRLRALRELRDPNRISADLKEAASRVFRSAGDKSADHIDHLISGPSHVALEKTDEELHKALLPSHG